MRFSYLTRGDSSPHGKARVCLLCHPEDLSKYLDEISRDIFETQNCSVWYPEPGQPLADAAFELSQMQLIVIPVTKKLLTEEEEIFTAVLPFAQKNRIPVLPIAVEPGLDALFSLRFGDLEYLNRTSLDPTAISYREKLSAYLRGVLLNDEQLDRIKDAFDAYIFLSYRKKDRACAKELMRLIHQNPFCERVAIWYDEFLTPGESFNEAIKSALRKSSLFSLVVTPNLICEKNYVMEVEYPLAQQEKKRILPVEMAETSLEGLRDKYEGIPTPIAPKDADSLEHALRDSLSLAVRTGSDDPVHRFFVGLAYLSGIDVEVDRERAVRLISEAAEAGLEPAMKKLAEMYSVGDGVTKDMPRALAWQKKLTWTLGEKAEETRKESDALEFLREQMRLTELAYSIEDYETAADAGNTAFQTAKLLCFGAVEKGFLKKAKSLFQKYVLNRSACYEESLGYLCKACRYMLDMAFDMGIHEDIMTWTKKASYVASMMSRTLGYSGLIAEFFLIARRMACELTLSGNLSGAKYWLEQAFTVYAELSDEAKTLEIKYSYSFLFDSASEYEIAGRRYKSAYQCQEERTELLQTLQKEYPDSFQIRCAIIQSWLYKARVAYLYGDWKNTVADARQAKDLIVEEIGEQQSVCGFQTEKDAAAKELIDGERGKVVSFDLKLYLAKYYMLLGFKEYAVENYENAVLLLKEGAYAILEPLLDAFFDAEHVRDAARICEKIGECYDRSAEYETAYEWHEKAWSLMENLMAFSNTVKDSRIMAGLSEKLLDDSINLGNVRKIEEWNEKALWLRKGLIDGLALPAMGFKKEKNIAEIAEKGNLELAFYQEDLQALERLRARQEEIRGQIGAHAHGGETLLAYAARDRAEQGFDFGEMAGVIRTYRETHIAKQIRDAVCVLENATGKMQRFSDLFDNESISALEVKRSVKLIYDSFLKRSGPIVKYEEESMLLAVYCGFLHTGLKLMGNVENELRDYQRFVEGIVFWKYPLDEIRYPELWRALYHLVKRL